MYNLRVFSGLRGFKSPSPHHKMLLGAVATPDTSRRSDYARKNISGEQVGEYWIAPRAIESWLQGSTGAARQPSVRP